MKPAQAASASTMKSSSRAWRPGAQNCATSSAADQHDGDDRGQQTVPGIGEAESQADQDEGQRMLTILTEIGMRPVSRRAERGESNGDGEQPGGQAEHDVMGAGASTIRAMDVAHMRCEQPLS